MNDQSAVHNENCENEISGNSFSDPKVVDYRISQNSAQRVPAETRRPLASLTNISRLTCSASMGGRSASQVGAAWFNLPLGQHFF